MELFASEFWFLGVCSTIGKLLSCDTCVDRFWSLCDVGLYVVKMRPAWKSEIWFVWVVSPDTLWWVCVCRSTRVSGTDNSLTSSGLLFQVWSFTFETCSILLLTDAFLKEAKIPASYPSSEFTATLVSSRPGDTFIDLFAKSILGATMLYIAVKIAFWLLFSTVSTKLLISLSIF